LLGLGAKVAETRDTGFQREVMLAAVRTLHSCKGDSLAHLFRLFQGDPEAREDPAVQPEPKDKTKSFLDLWYTIFCGVVHLGKPKRSLPPLKRVVLF